MFRFNIPLTKVDEERRLVFGLVTEQIVDQSGEILDYDSSKAHFQEWSDGISKATGGASLGNLRLMHQPVVAGKLIELNFDDALKQISCVARIVDDNVWKLVLEGCLTGFSMGGKYVKRWKDEANKAVSWFTARPVEVSVVDNPCVSSATFEYIKSDGSVELRKFHIAGDGTGEESMLTQEQIVARAAELAKAAGTPDAVDQYLAEAETLLAGELELAEKAFKDDEEGEKPKDDDGDEMSDGAKAKAKAKADEEEETEKSATAALQLTQVWLAPDGTTHVKKADGVAHILAPPQAESEVEKALRAARGELPAADPLADVHADLEQAHKTLVAANTHIAPLTKGLYEVRELASVLQSLMFITSMASCEARAEGDGSPVPAQLMEHLRSLGQTLVVMTQEEVAEMIAQLGSEMPELLMPIMSDVVELAAIGDIAKADSPIMMKVGARNNSHDSAVIQQTHDNAVSLGATCNCDALTEKAATPDDGSVAAVAAERDALRSEVEKAVAGIAELGTEMTSLRGELEKFKKSPQPLPPRTDAVVVERGGSQQAITQEVIEKMTDTERADLAIRIAQMQPLHVGG